MKADWAAIKADYLATGMAYQDLAKKWCVSISTLKKRAAREKWKREHVEIAKSAEPEPLEEELEMEPEPSEGTELIQPGMLASELRANRMRRMIETTDAMMDRVINAMELIKPGDAYALNTLVRTLKDLREMQGLNKSALDIEEQQLRIELMRQQRQSMIAEPVVVEFVNTEDAEK